MSFNVAAIFLVNIIIILNDNGLEAAPKGLLLYTGKLIPGEVPICIGLNIDYFVLFSE